MDSFKSKILVVDDENVNRLTIAAWLKADGFEVAQAANGREAISQLYDGISIIVTDLMMPQVDGMELLRVAKAKVPHVAVIIVTGSSSVDTALESLRLGASDYLMKPVNLPELNLKIRRAIKERAMAGEIAQLHAKLKNKDELYKMIGRSGAMRSVFEKIRLVAATNATVLITGESGTGKELVARAIHAHSLRSKQAFLPVNFAAISESLIESELFGHEAGSFTGANKRCDGVFQAANGGTLFLDEIGDLQKSLQSNLLRALENKTVIRVGSQKEEHVDIRMVAATNGDLRAKIAEGTFREDLFYRLNVVNISLPALRERREDIALLAQYFLETIAKETVRPVTGFTRPAMEVLERYQWPGNVRELRNTVESVIVMSLKKQIELSDLPFHITGAPSNRGHIDVGMTMRESEKVLIENTLTANGGHRKDTAEMLGISVRTLQRKVKEYQFDSANASEDLIEV